MSFLANNCDGSGPHSGPLEIRVYPLGAGGNLLLCQGCWKRENEYRRGRGIITGNRANWPQVDYATAEIYTQDMPQPEATMKTGQQIMCNGFPGVITEVCTGKLYGMVEVRLERGTV